MIERAYETPEQRDQLLVDAAAEGLILSSNHTDLSGNKSLRFMTAEEAAENDRENVLMELYDSDLKMVRVVEDLVDLLIAKGLITPEDLPSEAMDRIASRKTLRDSLES